MNVKEISNNLELKLLGGADGISNNVDGIYCCDLLSMVMGQAPAESIWLTVMGNVNSVAVAALADISCIVLCHGVPLDEDGLNAANKEGIPVLSSQEPVYQVAKKISELIG